MAKGRNIIRAYIRNLNKRWIAQCEWHTLQAPGQHSWRLGLPRGPHAQALLRSLQPVHASHTHRFNQPLDFHLTKWRRDRIRLFADSEHGQLYLRLYHLGAYWPLSAFSRRVNRGTFEARCAQHLTQHAIAHPPIVVADTLGHGPLPAGSCVIQQHLPSYTLLKDQFRHRQDSSLNPDPAPETLENLGPFLWKLFEIGVLHTQLDPGHILIRIATDPDDPDAFALNDFEHIILYRKRVPLPQRIAAIKRFHHRLAELPALTADDRRRVFQSYLACDLPLRDTGIKWGQIDPALRQPSGPSVLPKCASA